QRPILAQINGANGLIELADAKQDVREAGLACSREYAVQHSAAQIPIDEQDLHTLLGKRDRKVGGAGGFSVAGHWTGEDQCLRDLVRPREGDVGTKRPVS